MITSLRKGYSTGTVSTAAVKASIRYYFGNNYFQDIDIKMPGGERCILKPELLERLILDGKHIISRSAFKKESADAPDVTNGLDIYSDFFEYANFEVKDEIIGNNVNISELLPEPIKEIHPFLNFYGMLDHNGVYIFLLSSYGVGIAKKPGLPVKPGFPAVNPVPVEMIKNAVIEEIKPVIPAHNGKRRNFFSILYIPGGEETAKKTLNPRLGIEKGLSILGTTGYVVPISARAWLDTIKSSLVFLKNNGVKYCVFTPGRFSEKSAMQILRCMPDECFIEIGDFVSYSVRKARDSGIRKIIFAGQFGKLVKISLGARNTNAKYTDLDLNRLSFLVRSILLEKKVLPNDIIDNLCLKISLCNTTRQAYEYIFSAGFPGGEEYKAAPGLILNGIVAEAKRNLHAMAGDDIGLNVILISYEGLKLVEL